jgi:hypothetical protein
LFLQIPEDGVGVTPTETCWELQLLELEFGLNEGTFRPVIGHKTKNRN